MKRKPILILYAVALLFPVVAGAADNVQLIKSLEFKGVDGPVRSQNGLVVFSHIDDGGEAHNAVLLNLADGSYRNAVEGVPGARFIAANEHYLVYSSRGKTNTLMLRDNHSGEPVASTALRYNFRWGHIDKDRLIAVHGAGPNKPETTALVYRLPSLKPERSGEIVGDGDVALWGDKLVSVGYSLGIYSLDLRKIAVVDMPRQPGGGKACYGGPLRISGNRAVVATDCGQFVVVDLASARVERTISTDLIAPSFDLADGLILAVNPDGKEREVRVLELASGIELIRLPIEANFIAMSGNRLLAMQKGNRFLAPARFTIHALNLETIKSESFRVARVKDGCDTAVRGLSRNGDLHAAIEACEKSGIKSFINAPSLAPELAEAIGTYGVWLARTLSRYDEGRALLERLAAQRPDEKPAAELAVARMKARYLDPPAKDAPPAEDAPPAGVERVEVDFGGFSNPIAFNGDRIYIARWLCRGQKEGYRGVVLEVLDRKTLRTIRNVDIAACDFAYQDAISAIATVPGYIVLGLRYHILKQERSNVVVLDAESLEVTASGFIGMDVSWLRPWQGKLLVCNPSPHQPAQRLDPQSARLVAASNAEARACAEEGARLKSIVAANPPLMPIVETARYRASRLPGAREFSYRITSRENTAKIHATVKPRPYLEVHPVTGRDSLVWSFMNGPYRRYMLFDIEKESETTLFELDPAGRPVVSAVWDDFLFVALGRSLLVYDLNKRMPVKYEKELIRESSRGERDGVKRILVDNDRLIVSTLDDTSSRVIDLRTYLAGRPQKDFFAP